MTSPISAATQSRKRRRGLNVNDLIKVLDEQPNDYETAWHDLRRLTNELMDSAQQTVPTLAPSSLSLPDAQDLFNLIEDENVLWAGINETPVPKYLTDNIDRILAVTSRTHRTNEAFTRTILDQILISAIYEENTQTLRQRASSQPEDPAVLELQHETPLQRRVTYEGQARLLSGYADYTVWYDSPIRDNLATNLIIIEAKKRHYTDTCLGQLTAYMGLVHAYRKDKHKENSVIYGAASDGLSFRFCRIDNDGNWSQSGLLEWKHADDKSRIYSVFRSLIRIAALSSPSTSPIKNSQKRETILASFGSPARTHKFDYDLSALEIMEEDDETEIVSWEESSL